MRQRAEIRAIAAISSVRFGGHTLCDDWTAAYGASSNDGAVPRAFRPPAPSVRRAERATEYAEHRADGGINRRRRRRVASGGRAHRANRDQSARGLCTGSGGHRAPASVHPAVAGVGGRGVRSGRHARDGDVLAERQRGLRDQSAARGDHAPPAGTSHPARTIARTDPGAGASGRRHRSDSHPRPPVCARDRWRRHPRSSCASPSWTAP